MTGLVRTLTKRMASFSSLREKALASEEKQENDNHSSHNNSTLTVDTTLVNDSISSDIDLLSPPVMTATRFDFGNFVQGIKRKVSMRKLRRSDHANADTHNMNYTTEAGDDNNTLATSPPMSKVVTNTTTPANSAPPVVKTEVWEVLRGGKLSERPSEQLETYVKLHLIDIDIDHVNPETLLPNVQQLSVVNSAPETIVQALSPLLPQLKDLWINDVLEFPYVPRSAKSRVHYKEQLLASLNAFITDDFSKYLMNSYELCDVSFKEVEFHGYLRYVHKLSSLSFPEMASYHMDQHFFTLGSQRALQLEITTVPKGLLQDDDGMTIERPIIEDIHAPGLQNLQLHVIGQFPQMRRIEARELQEVTLVLSSIDDIEMFGGEFDQEEDVKFLLQAQLINYKGDLKLLHKMEHLLREFTGGVSLEVFNEWDEQVLKELCFSKATRIEITTRLSRTPLVNAPKVKHFTVVYQNPRDPVAFINVSSCFPLLETLEIKSKDSKALSTREPPLVTLLWMDRGNFNNLEHVLMNSRVRLDTGFFTHSFPTLRRAKITTLSQVLDNGLSQWKTPLLEELELYVDYTKEVGVIGDVSLVMSGFRCLKELYIRGITHLIIENCPYLELINSRYAGPMKRLNVVGSYILRGLVYDSPGGAIVDNVIANCDRFVREYKRPVRNYHLMVYDSFFSAFPRELEVNR